MGRFPGVVGTLAVVCGITVLVPASDTDAQEVSDGTALYEVSVTFGAVYSPQVAVDVPDRGEGFFGSTQPSLQPRMGVGVERHGVAGWGIAAWATATVPMDQGSVHNCRGGCLAIFETPELSFSTVRIGVGARRAISCDCLVAIVGASASRTRASWEGGTNFGPGGASSYSVRAVAGGALSWTLGSRRVHTGVRGTFGRAPWDHGSWSRDVSLEFAVPLRRGGPGR